ncbi:hypothetical protein C0Q70_16776 [Pomacea canaliculata]|uniref:Uncharacterized protein n=1 Tax=Pomacea canaliculata TaxID=400727 RepID=A0A2T7NQQ2_POMCA|nr:hypothetical protein C0Q70_16776 [Pomacea canaliculata]
MTRPDNTNKVVLAFVVTFATAIYVRDNYVVLEPYDDTSPPSPGDVNWATWTKHGGRGPLPAAAADTRTHRLRQAVRLLRTASSGLAGEPLQPDGLRHHRLTTCRHN